METALFKSLKPEEKKILDKQVIRKNRQKGYTLFFEEDQVLGLHLINSGKIKLYKTLEDGSIQILRIAKPGEIIGYRGLLGNGKYIATSEVIEAADISFFPGNTIIKIIESNHSFALAFLKKFAQDLSEVELKSIKLARQSSKERLAESLMILEEHFGTDKHGFIQIKLTRQELGAYTGVVAETIIRTLKNWEEHGWVELNKKQIAIRNKKQLEQL